MNFAIIGCGQYGKNYVKAIQETGDNLIAVCNRSARPEFLQNEVIYTTSVEQVLNYSSVETVVIATPPESHYLLTKLSLEAGKNVICEKPFVFSTTEAQELYDLALKKNLKLLINYTRVFSSYSEQLFKLISSNVSRKISVHLENGNWGPMRDYSSLWDYGSHELALVLCFIDINKAQIIKSKEENGSAKNFHVQISEKNLTFNCSFGNAFVSKRRGVIVYIDGAPHILLEDPAINPLRNLISFFKEIDSSHLFYNLCVPTTYVLEQFSKDPK